MKRIHLTLIASCIITTALNAQTQKLDYIQPYGKVDQADLEMKACDFEKDANAMVLFDYAAMDNKAGLPVGRHTRIKIFNDFGKGFGNMSLEYPIYNGGPGINDLKAETINFENGKVEVTQLDPKQVYTVQIDKWRSALKFAMPNLKAGSIIDITYRQIIPATWYFQDFIPVRYSEIELNIPSTIITRNRTIAVEFKSIPHTYQPYVKSTGESADGSQIRAMANIHSLPNEPYMSSRAGNLQRLELIGVDTYVSTWPKVGELLMKVSEFGDELDRGFTNDAEIIKNAKSLKTDDEKIAYIFDEVKNRMTWNGLYRFFAIDGTVKAWDKKTGNSGEINMIVYHLLRKAKVKAYPLVVCTKSNGKLNPTNADIFHLNNTVVYIPIDSTKSYVLDASRKENLYNVIPANILNTFGLNIDVDHLSQLNEYGAHTAYQMIFISNDDPVLQSVSLNAEVKPEGKMEGNAEITSYAYNKVNALHLYDTVGEPKYIDSLQRRNKEMKISSFKIENAAIDSLPLSQKFNFNLDLSASDGNYIYFNTNSLNILGKNPFYSEERFSDIDFGYRDNYAIYSVYKLPAGYKIDALPKTISIVMPDESMIFKRTVAEDNDNGTILVKYVLNHKKTIYFKEDYGDLRSFYNKMYDLLNEQIVLKKS
ncbi:MAG: DUF3857 domain-containing protein [Bacteroidetes bacterium]|jgi:hypothetical protein|nr:DUF3857 domain-containing protein [Bacteroidota bacterium]